MGKLLDMLAELDAESFPEGFIDSVLAAHDEDVLELTTASDAALAEKDASANSLAAQLETSNAINASLAAHNAELMLTGGDIQGPTEDDNESDDDYVEFIDPVEKFFNEAP